MVYDNKLGSLTYKISEFEKEIISAFGLMDRSEVVWGKSLGKMNFDGEIVRINFDVGKKCINEIILDVTDYEYLIECKFPVVYSDEDSLIKVVESWNREVVNIFGMAKIWNNYHYKSEIYDYFFHLKNLLNGEIISVNGSVIARGIENKYKGFVM